MEKAHGSGDSSLRILHVTDHFTTGGGLEHIFRICSGLRGYEFSVIAAAGPGESRFSELDGTQTVAGALTPETLSSVHPHLIHFHHIRPLAYWLLRRKKLPVIPIILTLHGLHVRKYDFQPSLLSPVKGAMRRLLEKKIFFRCDELIAVSRDDRNFLESRYGISGVRYIPNGIPIHYHPAGNHLPDRWRWNWKIPDSATVALVPARFDFQKGHDLLIRALARPEMAPHRGKIVFLLAGTGPLLGRTRTRARSAGVDSFLRFLGDCTHERVLALMTHSDLVVLPSRWEGLPIALLEAGMLSRPVIASDACGNREVIPEGGGLLFRNQDPADLSRTLISALSEPGKQAQWGVQLNRKVVSEYSLEKMLESLDGLYREFQSD